jgi:hypothetical protein
MQRTAYVSQPHGTHQDVLILILSWRVRQCARDSEILDFDVHKV